MASDRDLLADLDFLCRQRKTVGHTPLIRLQRSSFLSLVFSFMSLDYVAKVSLVVLE
jgi:hypothetical protein